MVYENPKQKLKEIKTLIVESEESKVSAEETLIMIEQLFPSKIIYKEVEPKSSPEKLQYLRDYRKFKKWLDGINNKQLVEEEKIKKALSRKETLCFKCQAMREVVNPTYLIKKKRNRVKKQILVSSNCKECGNVLRFSGGNI